MPTYNGWTVVTIPALPVPKTIEPVYNSTVAATTNPFNAKQQIHDWQANYAEMKVTMPPMNATDGMTWAQFLISCNGPASVFTLPTAVVALLPTGIVPGGYWRLKTNTVRWSVNEGLIYQLEFELREAI
jgi:hypothetical protein